jgi:hypothetical protein
MRFTNRHGKPARRPDGKLKTIPFPAPQYHQRMERSITTMHRRMVEDAIRGIVRRVRREAAPCS